jgi:superfamily II RNA helicase
MDVVSVVESTLEGPWPVLAAQLERARTETLARLKDEGMEYEERMEILREVEYPKPLADFLYEVFDVYRVRHPWARDHNVQPKSIVRDMYERSMGFSEYVAHYGLARSEGLLLRYFSDSYKALVQNVPEDTKSSTSRDITEWLGEIVRQVDSSLLDEWEMLSHPLELQEAVARGERPVRSRPDDRAPALTANPRAFRVMVRNAVFRRAELAARHDWRALEELDQGEGWDAARWEAAFRPYFAEHPVIGTGGDARGPDLWQLQDDGRRWRARLVLDDPAGFHEWAVLVEVELDASDRQGEPALRPLGVERL